MPFRTAAPYQPLGDQPHAIAQLTAGVQRDLRQQTLLGATGTGKTAVIGWVFEQLERPALVLAHNKTLASQLYTEFRELLPTTAVELFISYYDFYTPEAYVPSKDLYIGKESTVNEAVERLRHAATQALLSRRDVLIVASVAAIFGLGSPQMYGQVAVQLQIGETRSQDKLLRQLLDLQFARSDGDLRPGTFRVRGDIVDIFPPSTEQVVRVAFWGNTIERITSFDLLTGELHAVHPTLQIFPARHFVTTSERLTTAIGAIKAELAGQLAALRAAGKQQEAARLEQRTAYDLEMLAELGYCPGIENYSRHLDRREPGQTPWTLLDYFPDDFVLFVDESHMSLPQIRAMYHGDRARKQTLIDYGFRLPSALDNRPLRFEEFEQQVRRVIYVSATPGPYELAQSQQVVEQIIRPTGLIDPVISVRPSAGQIDDLLGEIRRRITEGQRVLVTTLTKRLAEELTDYFSGLGIRTQYLHADVDTFERSAILRDLRLGVYDVLVGINLLREGLDLPEVALVAILDADKEGYLRSSAALIQTIGRAARHIAGTVIMYADQTSGSMQRAIDETDRRRTIQAAYNHLHQITPVGISTAVKQIQQTTADAPDGPAPGPVSPEQLLQLSAELEHQMKAAARAQDFERAAALRDQVLALRETLADSSPARS